LLGPPPGLEPGTSRAVPGTMVTGRVILSGGQSFPFTASARPAPRGGAYTSQLTAVAICEKITDTRSQT